MSDVIAPSRGGTMAENVAFIGHRLKDLPQVECPLTHRFAPGVYVREIFMPAESIIIGHKHRTEHFNIILKGACVIVHEDGSQQELRAPLTFVSAAGVQKVLYIIEDTIWQTVHLNPDDAQDIEALEQRLTFPVPADPALEKPKQFALTEAQL